MSKPDGVTLQKKPLNEVSYGQDSSRKSASVSGYVTSGLCAGLPRVTSVKTAPGFCLGVLDAGLGLVKPRYALQIDARRILLTEMGGWNANLGQIYLLTLTNNKWERTSLLNARNASPETKCLLNLTHQLVKSPDGLIYLTSAECVASLDPSNEHLLDNLKIRMAHLPTDGLHNLKAITFDPQGNIYMNVGSRTDNCENETTDVCADTQGLEGRGVIRKYEKLPDGSYDTHHSIYSSGQRNSMALYWDDKNSELWTGENSRDYINRVDTNINGLEHPGDEFNVVRQHAQLDWPYCYDFGTPSPEFGKADCTKFQKPNLLFPAHSAPLSFLMYTGTLFPTWYQNRLLISFHGNQDYGHRIVAYKRNDQLQPVGEPLSLVYGWDAKGSQAVGSPVGLTQAADGSVLIVEDNSQKVLKLSYDATDGNGTAVAELKTGTDKADDSELMQAFLRTQKKRQDVFQKKLTGPSVSLFTQIQNKVIDQNCVACHGGLRYPGLQILMYDDIGNYKKLKDQILARIKGDGVPRMPPYGLPETLKAQLIDLVERWNTAGRPPPQ